MEVNSEGLWAHSLVHQSLFDHRIIEVSINGAFNVSISVSNDQKLFRVDMRYRTKKSCGCILMHSFPLGPSGRAGTLKESFFLIFIIFYDLRCSISKVKVIMPAHCNCCDFALLTFLHSKDAALLHMDRHCARVG